MSELVQLLNANDERELEPLPKTVKDKVKVECQQPGA